MKKILIPLLSIAVIGIIVYTMQGSGSQKEMRTQNFLEEIRQERHDKDNFMQLDEESPLSEEQKKSFSGLKYFAPDLDWRIEARLEENEQKEVVLLPTSDEEQTPFRKWGYAVFEKKGKEHRLLLLQAVEEGSPEDGLFLPFIDATSANETYGAGRYLDLKMPEGNTIVLDFNKAYNPYCAYAEGYSCPFPPKENNLSLAVRAGEKSFENYD